MRAATLTTLAICLGALLFLTAVPGADAGVLYVTMTGVDTLTCGLLTHPCRSITRGIANADPGDHIIVGPGRYDGESGATNCDCFLAVNKSVLLTSSAGAASTIIDARAFLTQTNVLVKADGSEFGRPGAGFTVTNPKKAGGTGIAIDSIDVKVHGNQVIGDATIGVVPGTGIVAVTSNPGPILIEANQVMLWLTGIDAEGSGKTVNKNQLSLNVTGAALSANSRATGNMIVASKVTGLDVTEAVTATGNGLYGNGVGLFAHGPFTGTIEHNAFVGSSFEGGNCGVANNGIPNLDVTENYWGAATGPGPDPADTTCGANAASTFVTVPFLRTPFPVVAPIRP